MSDTSYAILISAAQKRLTFWLGLALAAWLVFALAACAPQPDYPPDPHQLVELGEYYKQAGSSIIYATEQARLLEVDKATRDASVMYTAQTATAVAYQWQATATQQAFDNDARAATATVSAQQTVSAWPAQATATQIAVAAMVRQEQLEIEKARNDLQVQFMWSLLPAIFWGGLTLVTVFGLGLAIYHFLPAIAARIRTIKRGDGSSPVYVGQTRGHTYMIDPDRAGGPVVSINLRTGEASLSGQTDPLTQSEALRLAGMARIVAALPRGEEGRKQGQKVVQLLLGGQLDGPPALPAPPRVEIVDANDPAIRQILGEAERKLLEDGE